MIKLGGTSLQIIKLNYLNLRLNHRLIYHFLVVSIKLPFTRLRIGHTTTTRQIQSHSRNTKLSALYIRYSNKEERRFS